MGAIVTGLNNQEIAGSLAISHVTVKTHINNIFRKVGVQDRLQVTLYALQTKTC